MGRYDGLVEDLALTNEGVVLTRQMVAAGMTESDMRKVRPRLYRLCRGAYALARPETAELRHRMTARGTVQRYGSEVALSHVSAAVTLGLPVWSADLRKVHLTGVTGKQVRWGHRHRIHTHVGPLGDDEHEVMTQIPVTSPARTAIDCARLMSRDQAVAIFDAVLHGGTATRSELAGRIDALATHAGVEGARRALALADGSAESPGESRTRLILGSAGIEVTPQVTIRCRGAVAGRVDFQVTDSDVVIEFDGREKYRLGGDVDSAHWHEKRRQQSLEAAGYTVVRFTWDDLDRPGEVVERVRAALRRRALQRRGG